MGQENPLDFRSPLDKIIDADMAEQDKKEIEVQPGLEQKVDKNKKKVMMYKGFPYEGKPYTVDKDCLPVLGRKVHIKQFDLTDKEDMEEYNRIFQDRADGLNDISFEEKIYDSDLKSWRVLLRWFDIIYKEPKIKKDIKNG
jgi:hypothetical protein